LREKERERERERGEIDSGDGRDGACAELARLAVGLSSLLRGDGRSRRCRSRRVRRRRPRSTPRRHAPQHSLISIINIDDINDDDIDIDDDEHVDGDRFVPQWGAAHAARCARPAADTRIAGVGTRSGGR
jgi:hypothetical protein